MPPDSNPSCSPLIVHCKYDKIVSLDAHAPHPKNDNTHTPEQLAIFEKILRHRGIRRAAVVSKTSGYFITGHGLRETLLQMGVTGIPVDYQTFASADDEVGHLMADNQLGKLAIRNEEQTIANLRELEGTDLDLGVTGFTALEIEAFDIDVDDDFDDGFTDERGSKGSKELGDTQVQFGEYRIPVARADYLAWQEKLRKKVGFDKPAALKEIKRRLGL